MCFYGDWRAFVEEKRSNDNFDADGGGFGQEERKRKKKRFLLEK